MNLIRLKILTVFGFYSAALETLDFEFNAQEDVRFCFLEREAGLEDSDAFGLSELKALNASSFDETKPTTFQIHGYREGRDATRHKDLSR